MLSNSFRSEFGILILYFSNSPNISSRVKHHSFIPFVHSFENKPQLFFPITTPFNILECLLVRLWIFISPFSNCLKQNFPSFPLTSNLVSTLEPQNVKIPLRYDFKKNVNISLKFVEYFLRCLWFLLPFFSFLSSIFLSFSSILSLFSLLA